MKEFIGGLILALIFLWLISSIMVMSNLTQEIKNLKQQAITLGYAQYNPTNAVWQWKTNSLTISQ